MDNPFVNFYYEVLRETLISGLWPELALLRGIRDSDDLFAIPNPPEPALSGLDRIDNSESIHYQRVMRKLGHKLGTFHPKEKLESELKRQIDRLINEFGEGRGKAEQTREEAEDLTVDHPVIVFVERSGTNWKSADHVIKEVADQTERVVYLGLLCRDSSDGLGAAGWVRDWRMAIVEEKSRRDFHEPKLVVVGTELGPRTMSDLRRQGVLVVKPDSIDEQNPEQALRRWVIQARSKFLRDTVNPFSAIDPIFAGLTEAEPSQGEEFAVAAKAAVNPAYGKFPAHSDPELFYGPYLDWLRRGTLSDD